VYSISVSWSLLLCLLVVSLASSVPHVCLAVGSSCGTVSLALLVVSVLRLFALLVAGILSPRPFFLVLIAHFLSYVTVPSPV